MATAEDVLRVARSQIGTVEKSNGSNPYGMAYGVDGVWWCMQFVWWCFREAGAGALIHPKTAYTPTAADWHRANGSWVNDPQPGDLVFYDWPDNVYRIQHVGIVEAVEPGAIVVIEGNTVQPGKTGNQSNGDGVWRVRRARNSWIVGYGRPRYAAPVGGDWFDMATKAELEEIVSRMMRAELAPIAAKVDTIHHEVTQRLKSRVDFGLLNGITGERVPTDDEKVSDTLLGQATNADARVYETRQLVKDAVLPKLDEVLAALEAVPVSGGGKTALPANVTITGTLRAG